jgi:hypothetical protein
VLGSRRLTVALIIAFAACVYAWAPASTAPGAFGQGRPYEPAQPLAFSHRLHAGDMQIGCLYCHFGAEKSRYAGIPAASICMNCHRAVTDTASRVRAEATAAKQQGREARPMVSAEIQKLYDHLGLGDDREREPGRATKPIAWTLVHTIPDFVYFDHRAHVGAGVNCSHCHGAVERMERVRQEQDFTMGWCVNCHRDATERGVAGHAVRARIDCSVCHR